MRIAVCTLLAALGGLALAPGLSQATLPEPVARALKAANIPQGNVALWVGPADGGPAIMTHNADKPFNPASVMKLLTTTASLDLLGPNFSWTTEAYANGTLRNGVLTGDLVLRGSGDPALSWDRFGQLLRDLRGRGLREIHGDLVLDRSLFDNPAANGPDFDDQPLRAYNALPDALLVNFKAFTLRLTPQEARQPIAAVPMTPFAPITLDNQLRATAGACGDWRGGIATELRVDDKGMALRLTGSMPASCGEHLLNLTVQDGPRFAAGIFRALWSELGGSWQGKVREGSAPIEQTPLAVWRSPPLENVVRDINKYSNNVMARELFLTLSSRATNANSIDANAASAPPAASAAATPRQSEEVLRAWLRRNHIEMPALVLENGSGLSRNERVSAEGLANLLQYAWHSPRMPILVASLPIAGDDGTAKRRFSARPVSGRAYLKTGSLDNVMSIAGYVQDAYGHWLVLVIMINDPHAELAEAATIQAADWVYERTAATATCCARNDRPAPARTE